jgi:hypothetical protein
MQYLAFLLAALFLAACSSAPPLRSQSQGVNRTHAAVPESQQSSLDSVVQFLLTSAASDFHAHGPSPMLRFRDVRIGHLITQGGDTLYVLCGHFHKAQDGARTDWIPFETIKTSGYEQNIGGPRFCQDSAFVWDKLDDLSSLLQTQFDSQE